MSSQIVTVTFKDDLPQFEVMLHCLNTYWLGHRNITICCTDSVDQVKYLVDSILDSSWSIYFYPKLNLICDGYHQQQIYKIKASIDSTFDDSIVFDSKDFLLKSMSEEDFKNHLSYKYAQFFDPSKTFQDIYPLTVELEIPLAHLPLPLILTPWIWNKHCLTNYWNYLNKKFGDYSTWKGIPTGSEWAGYFAYTFNKDLTVFDNLIPYWMPIAGVWKGQSDQEITDQLNQFDLFTDRKVWKHHRAVKDLHAVNTTSLALEAHNIKDLVINHWISNYMLT